MKAPHLPIPELTIDDGTPRSLSHGDIYFSAQDGLAETRHVFLAANGLPARFENAKRFTIAETGFGTGLNFLAAWQAWEEAGAQGELVFISVEQSPLTPAQMATALAALPVDAAKRDWLVENTPLRIPGWHRVRAGSVHLMLGYGDALDLYKQLNAHIDAWFLDGFAPAKNPDMWQPELFGEMARLSAKGATLSSFTAAGSVRAGLADAGFTIEKTKGYGHKRDMIRGSIRAGIVPAPKYSQSIAVIGAGIAGATTAHALAELGHYVTVYEAGEVASGASGNQAGALYPNIGKRWNAGVAETFLAYAHMHAQLRAWKGAGLDFTYAQTGMLKLPKDAEEKQKLADLQTHLGLDASIAHWLDADAASEKAGITLQSGGAWFEHGAWLQPKSLCAALLAHTNITLHTHRLIEHMPEADAVVLACAYGAQTLLPEQRLYRSAGQLSLIDGKHISAMPRSIICHKGYALPQAGALLIGATYDHDDLGLHIRAEHHQRNIDDCRTFVPSLLSPDAVARDGRIAHRVTTPDKRPVIDRIMADSPMPVYGNFAHGSRGLLTAPYGASRIAAEISALPLDVRALNT